ncbi:hypothetical protein [Paraburkholderia youngii]|uniref:hypothetical protein n=1 Tax=Paraburkholderia youngii TaxID=2782701 RepID=UPI003D2292AB
MAACPEGAIKLARTAWRYTSRSAYGFVNHGSSATASRTESDRGDSPRTRAIPGIE